MGISSGEIYAYKRIINCVNIDFIVSTFEGKYEGVSKSFLDGRLELELQMVELSAIRCSYIAIL
jgi:hypothetical protein